MEANETLHYRDTLAEFERLANEAKAGCPISKLLNCEITLEARLED